MKNLYTTEEGKDVALSGEEIKLIRALIKLEKMRFGNLKLFAGGGFLSVRYGGYGRQHEITAFSLPIDGGDGGDKL